MGHVSFCGRPLLTAPGRVMTPRSATERLVTRALAFIGDGTARVVDVGTGCGALAVAVAAAAPGARANVRNNGLEERVTVYHGDLLAPVPGAIDVVVANLPYLPVRDAAYYPDLAAEPAEAVFASGDGLDPYRRLLVACDERLADDGAVFLQLHREVLTAGRDGLSALRARLEPQLAAA